MLSKYLTYKENKSYKIYSTQLLNKIFQTNGPNLSSFNSSPREESEFFIRFYGSEVKF